ncbi:tRNA-dihydrouridine synthase [Candidatus Parcubacteria bacterium]|nr:tRNA-dihydrouridine synthase [Candidatus Parcubacteria bacterium]
MNQGFWKQLKKPFFTLAPMMDVTDLAFRQIVIECGRPDVFFTEFVSCDGLCSEIGRPKLLPHLKFKENERPIVAQFFGSKPENFYKCAQLAVELGFDGIDINMGCPENRVVSKQGAGAALILKPELAQEIIKETKRGAGDLPVSVKTRIGFNSINTEEWISALVKAQPAAITVHGRTKKEMSSVPAHWDEIGKAAKIIKEAGIVAIGNGDVLSYKEGLDKVKEFGLDGIMIGRGIFNNIWFFNPEANLPVGPKERIRLLKKHIELFVDLWGKDKNFDVIKRFIKVYINDFEGSKDLRTKLMTSKNQQDVDMILQEYQI